MLTFASKNGYTPRYYFPITLSYNPGSGVSILIIEGVLFGTSYPNVTLTAGGYYIGNVSNVNIQDGQGNILTTWLESGYDIDTHTNTGLNQYYWVKLPNSTITTLYLVCYDNTANVYDGVVTGGYPNMTGTYGQYDNGSSLFKYYTNWSGTSLPSNWAATGSYTVNNGVQINPDGSNISYLVSEFYMDSLTDIIEFNGYVNTYATSNHYGYTGVQMYGFPSGVQTTHYLTNISDSAGNNYYAIGNSVGSSYTDPPNTDSQLGTGAYTQVMQLWEDSTGVIAGQAASFIQALYDSGTRYGNTSYFGTIGTNTQIELYIEANSPSLNTPTIFSQWLRVRTLATSGNPDAVPTTTLGSVNTVVPIVIQPFHLLKKRYYKMTVGLYAIGIDEITYP